MQLWGNKKNFKRIPVNRLVPGMHVSVAERWWDHPFLLNEFTLESAAQIEIIVDLGMTTVLWSESLSAARPLAEEARPAPRVAAAPSEEHLRAKAQREDRIRCWEEGASEYMTKPFSPSALSSTLAQLMDMSSEERDSRRVEMLRKLRDIPPARA